ncbi:restriction endonuclease subunit S [uncultured Marinobacter sp.]|uniref:restriction endonuclease subunit S n=1 Tax=uncultured Marinobacter sp. TaxID=187379 RepID=UPI0025F4E3B4|nr:restriction endonuclease subunit S [uncultured Marinobacter sp.]
MSFHKYPEYKSIDFDWLDELPESWSVKKLKYVAGVRASGVDKHKREGEQEVKFLGTDTVYSTPEISKAVQFQLNVSTASTNDIKQFQIEAGDLLVTKDSVVPTRIADVSIIVEPMEHTICGYHLVLIRPKPRLINPRFLFYCIKSKGANKYLLSIARGTTIIGISAQTISGLRLPEPSLLEQSQIAQFLDHETTKIDALIREQERLIELLQEKRQAVISHAVTKGLDPDVPTKDSGVEWLGEVPAHWKVMPVKFLVSFVTSGSRGWADFYSDSGELFFRITNLTRDSIRPKLESIQYVTPPEGSEGSRAKIKVGDILVSITADLGSVCAADKSIEGGYVSQHVALARPIATLCSSNWLAYFILGNAAKEQLLGSGYGGTKVQLSLEDIRELVVAVPPTDEQISIAQMLDKRLQEMEALISEAKAAMALLSERRSALISAAVTGKIDVRNWQPPTDENAFNEEVRQTGIEATV